ncbi:MAG: FAD binding domain-containing protein [Dehalococcoidales bacterium]|nr:FAD binding domain-containing protein [Dehalococcoidales bacterium]
MKTLKKFELFNAGSLDEAVSLLRKYGEKAWVMAGGTDLIGTMRFEVLRDYPEVVINLKTIPGMEYIREEDGFLRIGALTRLEDIARSSIARNQYTALAEAASRTASPHIREMGTIGGNICQLIRCWYFRKEDNRFDCIRKGGDMCHAAVGDNRYHSIFGAVRVGPPPCTSGCPAGNDIPYCLDSIREGNLSQAAQILLNSNPLPAITGRVCPHECEQRCNRRDLDEAVSINSIERFVGDYALEHAAELYKAPLKENTQKVAVVGSGPAGLSAAYYLRQLGFPVTIYEALEEAGGVLTYGIPPYRLSKDVVKKQVRAIENTGVRILCGVKVGLDISLADLQRDYNAVFLASGAWKPSTPGLADEDLLTLGLDFLGRVNLGLRQISTGKVLVIGGGSVAFDVATSALRLGAGEVTLACLESREEMPAQPSEIEQALREGIELMPGWGPAGVIKNNGRLSGVELVKCTSVFNSEGHFAPVYDNAIKKTIEADMVILAIGQRPDLAFVQSSLKTKRGLIEVNPETGSTSLSGVFAGGDAAGIAGSNSGSLSVVAALADGRRAAISISQYLGGKANLPDIRKTEHLIRCQRECPGEQGRVKTPALPLDQLSMDKEDVLGMDLGSVETEADRCLNCGCDGVNPSDMAAALVALDARIVTSGRIIQADHFWAADRGLKPTVLEDDEIITEIRIPRPKAGAKSAFIKFAIRKSIDFPIVNCAAAVETERGVVRSARICLNAVYCHPYRAFKAEEAIQGQTIEEANADAAGAAAVSDAVPLPYNKFKIQIARTLVKRALLSCKSGD